MLVPGPQSVIKSIQRYSDSISSSNLSKTVTISSVNVNKSVVIPNGSTATPSSHISDALMRFVLTNSTTVTITRGGSGTLNEFSFTVIEYV